MTDRSILQRLAAALSPPPHDAQNAPSASVYNTLPAPSDENLLRRAALALQGWSSVDGEKFDYGTVPLQPKSAPLSSYLSDILYDTRSQSSDFNVGPFSGTVGQRQPFTAGTAQDTPLYFGDVGINKDIGNIGGFPVSAQPRVMIMNQGGLGTPESYSSVSPTLNMTAGPVGLSAGFDLSGTFGGSTTTPRLGAAASLPVRDGDAILRAGVTPNAQNYGFGYNRQIDPNSALSVLLDHVRPQDGKPSTTAGIAYRRRF